MRKLRQVQRVRQRFTYKHVLVVSSVSMALAGVVFSVFNAGVFQSESAKANVHEAAEAKENIKFGDEIFYQDYPVYEQAIPYYMKAVKVQPENAELNDKLGLCYLFSGNKFMAFEFFEKAFKLNPDVDPLIHFYLGRSLQINSDWDRAITEYGMFLSNAPGRMQAEVKKHIQECHTGRELSKTPVPVTIENLGSAVNSKYPEYSPYISADESEIFFTSRRPDTYGGELDFFDGNYFEDIYFSTNYHNSWVDAQNLAEPVNTKTHDAVAGISSDGKTLFVFKGDKNSGDILMSKLVNGTWSKPSDPGKNINTKYHESSACLSPDQQTLYFISDRPGGIGGRDIYSSKWNSSKEEWGKAENMGEALNTDQDEEGVFIHPDGQTLYFSSKGHATMGGYDIFESHLAGNAWTSPTNIGSPINTPDDDIFFTVSSSGNAYYASIRKEGFGEKDIYRLSWNNQKATAAVTK